VIYFDNAATTLPCAVTKVFYNPSSPHALGIQSERALRDARKKVALSLGSSTPEEVIFTSGGTESNNLAILGFTLANHKHGVSLASAPYEHPSILAPSRFAKERGWATEGSNKTTLVSLSHVNHETGDINDINAMSANIKKDNPLAIIHVDGAQGFCKEPLNLHGIDMYSFSGHKCHGAVGVGGLWVKKGIRLVSLQHGGGQEGNLRSGTENVAGIVHMAEAVGALSRDMQANHAHVAKIKSAILCLQDMLPDVCVNNLSCNVSPYILNMSFLGLKGEIIVHALSEKGVYVSMGAACNSRKRAPSTLELMGFSPEIAQSAVRFSFSSRNSLAEAEQACQIVIDTVQQLRKVIRK